MTMLQLAPVLVVLLLVHEGLGASASAPQSGRASRGQPAAASLGPISFDPKGADFTAWVNHFKDQVYRHWLLPDSVRKGKSGHTDLEFTVTRDGSIRDLRILLPSGRRELDRAAESALRTASLLSLPEPFPDDSVTMWLTFWYNSSPKKPKP